MNKAGIVVSFLVGILLLTLVILPLGCTGGESSADLKVVSTTSLISSIVEKVGGDKVEVTSIIPPAQCPGQFDVKPSDIKMLADARLFLMHGWQGELFTQQLIQSADNPTLNVISLNVQGNWMVPAVQAQAVGNITSALAEIDLQNAAYYQSNAELELASITAKADELQAKLAAGNLSQIKVICDVQIAGLAQWAGFNVVASYSSPVDINKLSGLIDQGKQAGVTLVIGNLQSGAPDEAETIANGIGAAYVILSNFPGGFDNTDTWEKAIDKDASLLLEVLAK